MDHPQLPGGSPRSNLTPPEFFPQGIKGGGDWHFLPAQPVNRFDDHQVAGPELPQKPLIEGPFKVLAAGLVRKNVFLRNAELLHGDELAFLALVFRGYADVSIRFIHIPASYPFFIFIV